MGLAEFSANYSNPSTLNATSLRMDQAVGDKWRVFGRYNYAPSNAQSRRSDNLGVMAAYRTDTRSLTLGASAILTSRIANELRFNFSDNNAFSALEANAFGGSTPVLMEQMIQPSSRLLPIRRLSNSISLEFRPECRCSISRTTGSSIPARSISSIASRPALRNHQLKFGVDYRRTASTSGFNNYVANVTYTSAQGLLNNVNTAVIRAAVPAKPVYSNLSVFGQDAWKLSSQLTLTLGVRWEVNPSPSNALNFPPVATESIANLASMEVSPAWHADVQDDL